MSKLSEAELREAIQELSGWVDQDGKLTKTFTHSSFPEAIVFVNAVAHIAELANHHPDIDVRYSNITLSLVTHDEGGITPRDVALARQVEAIRRKAGVPA
ncbi:MAG TPA: 4a-hydroxytetrahydrobiopterin dehydratase [Candidatus Eisenbacteria bacterium]|jgi:4a-hydroxytetrahydrobiopterin dehydratase|nr:4a-hydroxytetrahydrobiopterin dehydratase [Candidatus Eisenbacteria bacterium]HZV90882.1 4a-hydroxytetrahydrobiopterin dehydratase [Candidatus Nitrosocosmicus sp.]